MKTMFDGAVRDEIIMRVTKLSEASERQWGKMEVHQMVKHCILWDKWVLGKTEHTYHQTWLGKIFGKTVLKGMVKDDRRIKKNMPSGRFFIVKDKSGDLQIQKQQWVQLIGGYGHFSNTAFIHDFFGVMTKDEIGIFAYKHTDHHLRQFGV